MAYWRPKSAPVVTGRKYPDGVPIPDSLPGKYKMSERCDNCKAYVPSSVPGIKYCITWDALVRPEYVCAAWVPIQEA